MYGPAFDGSGDIVNRKVVAADVAAFRGAGYEVGSVPEIEKLKQEVKEIKKESAVKGKK